MAVDYTQRSVTGSNADKTEELSLLRLGAGMLRQRRSMKPADLGCHHEIASRSSQPLPSPPSGRSKLNILFFTDHFRPEPSAPAAHIFERCRLWVAGGHQVTVMTSAPNFPEGRVYPGYRNSWRAVEMMDGVRVIRVKTYIARNEGFVRRILDYLSYMCSSFWAAFGEPRPDVIISSSPHLFVAYAGCAHAFMWRVPHVIEVRDLGRVAAGRTQDCAGGWSTDSSRALN